MIGTRTWISKTSGDLTRFESLRLLATIISLRAKARVLPATKIVRRDCRVLTQLPDSKLVRMATEECLDCCTQTLFHHSCRTYFWAAALASIDQVHYDPEELAVASLLHDLHLGKTQTRAAMGCNCFAGAGVAAAEAWLMAHNVGLASVNAIAEAIALHLNPGVPLSSGATAHLLNVGAMADVVGTRISTIAVDQREIVLAGYPRSGFKKEMAHRMRAEHLAAPKTRAGFLMNIGFARMIDMAPFEE